MGVPPTGKPIVDAMEPRTSAPEPVFVTVRGTGALAVPTNWFAKFTVEGERETAA